MIKRIRQFWRAIKAKLTVEDKVFIDKYINDEEQKLFFAMRVYDQRHVLNVAYTAQKIIEQKQYENAIAQFNKIIDGKDFVAQNAYYHLGESYLDLGQKTQAFNAFKNASEMDFNTELQEDATLNYAKLSYEIGNSYESVPSILLAFLDKYPRNPNVAEVERLLIDSYISSKNYKEALVLMVNYVIERKK